MEKSRHLIWMGSKLCFLLVLVSLIIIFEITFVKFGWLFVHEVIDRMAGNEVDELHLQLESKLCVLSFEELVSLAEHLGVESKELKKLVLSKKDREKIEGDLDEVKDKKVGKIPVCSVCSQFPPQMCTSQFLQWSFRQPGDTWKRQCHT